MSKTRAFTDMATGVVSCHCHVVPGRGRQTPAAAASAATGTAYAAMATATTTMVHRQLLVRARPDIRPAAGKRQEGLWPNERCIDESRRTARTPWADFKDGTKHDSSEPGSRRWTAHARARGGGR